MHGKSPCNKCWKQDSGVHLKSGWVARAFVWRYLDLARTLLARCPNGRAVSVKTEGTQLSLAVKERVCSSCSQSVPESQSVLESFSQMLADKVDEAVNEVGASFINEPLNEPGECLGPSSNIRVTNERRFSVV